MSSLFSQRETPSLLSHQSILNKEHGQAPPALVLNWPQSPVLRNHLRSSSFSFFFFCFGGIKFSYHTFQDTHFQEFWPVWNMLCSWSDKGKSFSPFLGCWLALLFVLFESFFSFLVCVANWNPEENGECFLLFKKYTMLNALFCIRLNLKMDPR